MAAGSMPGRGRRPGARSQPDLRWLAEHRAHQPNRASGGPPSSGGHRDPAQVRWTLRHPGDPPDQPSAVDPGSGATGPDGLGPGDRRPAGSDGLPWVRTLLLAVLMVVVIGAGFGIWYIFFRPAGPAAVGTGAPVIPGAASPAATAAAPAAGSSGPAAPAGSTVRRQPRRHLDGGPHHRLLRLRRGRLQWLMGGLSGPGAAGGSGRHHRRRSHAGHQRAPSRSRARS